MSTLEWPSALRRFFDSLGREFESLCLGRRSTSGLADGQRGSTDEAADPTHGSDTRRAPEGPRDAPRRDGERGRELEAKLPRGVDSVVDSSRRLLILGRRPLDQEGDLEAYCRAREAAFEEDRRGLFEPPPLPIRLWGGNRVGGRLGEDPRESSGRLGPMPTPSIFHEPLRGKWAVLPTRAGGRGAQWPPRRDLFLGIWRLFAGDHSELGLPEGGYWSGGAVLCALRPPRLRREEEEELAAYGRETLRVRALVGALLVGLPGVPAELIRECCGPFWPGRPKWSRDLCGRFRAWRRSDLDLFICGPNTASVRETQLRLQSRIKWLREDYDDLVVASRNAVTVYNDGLRPLQIIQPFATSLGALLQFGDLEATALAFDGEDVFASERSLRGLSTRCNYLSAALFRNRPDTPSRVGRYLRRGFHAIIEREDGDEGRLAEVGRHCGLLDTALREERVEDSLERAPGPLDDERGELGRTLRPRVPRASPPSYAEVPWPPNLVTTSERRKALQGREGFREVKLPHVEIRPRYLEDWTQRPWNWPPRGRGSEQEL